MRGWVSAADGCALGRTRLDKACRRPIPATNRLRLSTLSTMRAHRAENGRKGAGGPRRAAHFQLARQDAAGQQHVGQHDGELAERALEKIERALLPDQAGKVADDLLEAAVDVRALLRFAPVERDRFGVFAQAHQAEAEVGFAPQLPEIQLDQRAAEEVQGDDVARHRVRHQHGHEQVRDRPQHGAEGDQLHERAEEDQQEVDGPARERVDVLADALVGIVDLVAGAQRIVFAVLQVAVEETAREPAPPLVREHVAHVVVKGIARHGEREDEQTGAHGRPEAVGILAGQRRRQLAGLVVQHDGELGVDQHQHDQQQQQGPGLAFFIPQPIGLGDVDEVLPCGERQGRGSGLGGGVILSVRGHGRSLR